MIEICDVYKQFNNKPVLHGVNLVINDGEAITIIGGSGCGKSVLLKHIIGLLRPEKGDVRIDNESIVAASSDEKTRIRKKFGFLFQGAALFDSLTVQENVMFGLRNIKKLPEEEMRTIADEKLALVGMSGTGDLMPSELSGGMKKRVGLARAIAYEPSYILYDEPTTGLDPIMSDVINELIIALQKKLKITSIIVTHDMHSAYKISDRIAMLSDGKIIASGTPTEIQHTDNPTVHRFITASAHQ